MPKNLYFTIGVLFVLFTLNDAKYLSFIDQAYAQQQCVPISGSSTADQSSAVQCAINALPSTGGIVNLPSGTIYAQGLSLPYNVIIQGQGRGATTLMLPANATSTYLVADITYANQNPWASTNSGIRDLTLDGNKSNNTKISSTFQGLLILQSWRFTAENCGIQNSPLHGILYTDKYDSGGMAENMVRRCTFDTNNGAGIYAAQNVNPNGDISDFFIQDSIFNTNGTAGYYQIDLERSAGFHIMNNQFYGGTTGELRALEAGVLEVMGNNFDGTNENSSGGIISTVFIQGAGWGNATIIGNNFHTHATNIGGASSWVLLSVQEFANNSGIAVTGNSFLSTVIPVTAISTSGTYYPSIVESGNSLAVSPQQINHR